MTNRERILAIFQKKPADRIVWQPRLEHWYDYNKITETLPEKYKDKKLYFEIYDDLSASVRYYYFWPLKFPYKDKDVRIRTKQTSSESEITTITETPVGTQTQRIKLGEYGTSRYPSEFPIKRVEDFQIMSYILSHDEVEFDYSSFEKAEKELGERGVVQCCFPRSPLQRLIIQYMGFENTIYALHDYPRETKDLLKFMEENDDKMYEVLCKCPVKILNFGENIDAHIDSPRLFEEYLTPYYKKRVAQLHKAGKFCYIHIDGAFKPLLSLIKANEWGFDGFEALTPLPQGDVTLEEMKDALGDKSILLDGIPATHFLPQTSYQELEKFTLKMLDLFSPNLILGISDEISPPGDIEKVRLVSEIVKDYVPGTLEI